MLRGQVTFEAVQQRLDARRTTGPKRVQHDHLAFRQTIACPRCDRFLTTYQTTKRNSDRSGTTRFFCSCRSTAGGRPRCKGVHYPAWEFEQAVAEIFTGPTTWRDLLGPDATGKSIHQAMDAWRVMLWQWQRDWLRNTIEQIEIDEPHDKIAVTFKADAGAAFLLENAPV